MKKLLKPFLPILYAFLRSDEGKKFIISILETYCDFTEIILKDTNYKDQISRYFQQTFNVYPKYKTEKYENVFRSSIFNGGTLITVGSGESKKKAEQDVSKKALIHFNVISAF